MKKLMMLVSILFVFQVVNGQSKQEQIVSLNQKVDSIKNVNKTIDSVLSIKTSEVNGLSMTKAQKTERLNILRTTAIKEDDKYNTKWTEYNQVSQFVKKNQDTSTIENSEQLLINKHPDKFRRNEDTLIITLNNGQIMKFVDESEIGVEKEGENGEEVSIYSDYLNYALGDIMCEGKYYLVEFGKTTLRGSIAVMGEDENNVLLINSNTGQIDSLVSEPKFSPDKKRYLSLGYSAQGSMGGVVIRNTENNKTELKINEYMGKMMEGEPEWVSDTYIKFTPYEGKILKINWNGTKWVITK